MPEYSKLDKEHLAALQKNDTASAQSIVVLETERQNLLESKASQIASDRASITKKLETTVKGGYINNSNRF